MRDASRYLEDVNDNDVEDEAELRPVNETRSLERRMCTYFSCTRQLRIDSSIFLRALAATFHQVFDVRTSPLIAMILLTRRARSPTCHKAQQTSRHSPQVQASIQRTKSTRLRETHR